MLLDLKKSMPNVMIYGDLGIPPQNLSIHKCILNVCARRINGKHDKISVQLYKLINFIIETCISQYR